MYTCVSDFCTRQTCNEIGDDSNIENYRAKSLVSMVEVDNRTEALVSTSHIDELESTSIRSPIVLQHVPEYPRGWPRKIACEMNVGAWEEALRKAGILSEYKDVIDGFKNGFDQGIPDHNINNLSSFTPSNHSSSLLVADKIKSNIKKEVDKKRMFGPFSHDQVAKVFPFYRSSPLGAVVNGDGSVRPINDLSYPRNVPDTPSVNSFVDKNKFSTTWDDFDRVATFFRSSKDLWLLGLFDWEKAYRQIPTLMSQWRYLLVLDFDDQLYVDTRITFGGVAGCGSFGRPADAWKQIMQSEHDIVMVFRWVDDNLFLKRYNSTTEMAHIVERSKQLGVQTNEEKLSSFQHEQKFIGFIWNGMNKTVRLPESKLEQRRAQIDEVLNGGSFTFNEIEIFVGRLNHVAYLLPQLKCYLRGLHRMKKEWHYKIAKRRISDDIREDLLFWKLTLGSFKHLRLIASPEPVDIAWVGDASTSYGIGVLVGNRWTQFGLTQAWKDADEDHRHINYLETVTITIGLLMVLQLMDKPGRRLVVWTDNTTAQAAITNRRSKNKAVNDEWKRIQHLLIDSQLDLVARRVTSADNIADKLSRGLQGGCLESDRVSLDLPTDLSVYLTSSKTDVLTATVPSVLV